MCHRRNIRDGMNNETVESIIKNFPCRPIPYCTFKCTIINAKRNSCIYLCFLLFRGKYLKIQKKTEKKNRRSTMICGFCFVFFFLIPYVLLNYSDDGTKVGSISSWNVTSPAANNKKKGGNTQNVNDENNNYVKLRR